MVTESYRWQPSLQAVEFALYAQLVIMRIDTTILCKYGHTSLNRGISGLLHCREGGGREREGEGERGGGGGEKGQNIVYTHIEKAHRIMTRIYEYKVCW